MARPIFGLILILIGVLVGFSLLTQNAGGNASGATYIAEKVLTFLVVVVCIMFGMRLVRKKK